MVYTEQDRQRAIAELRQNLELIDPWPVNIPWSREDQINALKEDWGLSVTKLAAHNLGKIHAGMHVGVLNEFNRDNARALAFMKLRAEQGSELHQRALALHIAAVMGHLVHA